MTKNLIGLYALFFTTLVLAEPAQVPKLGEVHQSIQARVTSVVAVPTQVQNPNEINQPVQSDVGDTVKKFIAGVLTEKPRRDFLTLVIGGISGFAVGGVLSSGNIFRVEVLGSSIVPFAGGLAGIYFANEGHFDRLRNMLGDKF